MSSAVRIIFWGQTTCLCCPLCMGSDAHQAPWRFPGEPQRAVDDRRMATVPSCRCTSPISVSYSDVESCGQIQWPTGICFFCCLDWKNMKGKASFIKLLHLQPHKCYQNHKAFSMLGYFFWKPDSCGCDSGFPEAIISSVYLSWAGGV